MSEKEEKKEEAPLEISVDEFLTLSDEVPEIELLSCYTNFKCLEHFSLVEEKFLNIDDLNWLAAAIDGEGSIMITKSYFPAGRPSLVTRVRVTNNCVEFCEKAKSITNGGSIALSSGKTYQWEIRRRYQVKQLLEELLPFLIVKKKQAEVMLQYVYRRQRLAHLAPVQRRYTDLDFAFYYKLRQLNKKGKKCKRDKTHIVARLDRGKVKESELLVMVEDKAMTAAGLAKAFKITYSAMWSRLKRLVNAGQVIRKYKEGKAFYLKIRPGMTPQVVAETETPDEVPAEDFLDEET